MRRSKPYLQQDERNILNEDAMNDQAVAYNDVNEALIDKSLPTDPYERVQAETLNAYYHGGGYIHPQNRIGGSDSTGGYINPSNGGSDGGFFLPILGSLAATVLPDAIKWIVKKIHGKGINDITGGTIHTRRPLNMSNAHSFYTSLADDLSEQLPKEYVHKKFGKLFGSGWKKYYKRKDGGAILDHEGMKIGHLLAPLLFGHLKLIKNIDPEAVMNALEKHPIMEKKVNGEGLQCGGSILGSLWGILKNVLTSDTTKSIIKQVAPKAIDALSNYAKKKLKEKEPEVKKIGIPNPLTKTEPIVKSSGIDSKYLKGPVGVRKTIGRAFDPDFKKKKISGGWVVKLSRE
jgi:hypothetical protein